MRFKPVFSRDDVAALADRYLHPKGASDRAVIEDEQTILKRTAPGIRRRGYVQLEELKAICRWKSARSARHVAKNDPLFVRETTHAALSTPCDRLRIEVLTLLDGVEWPTASVLLHFAAADPTRRNEAAYPILDFRALESLGIPKPPPYTYAFWKQYTDFCRTLARDWQVDMRTLDRALWQHSKERKP